jgi:hypothetical protein
LLNSLETSSLFFLTPEQQHGWGRC